MKLSSVSALVFLLPAFVSAVSLPEEGLVARARNQNNNGNTAAQAVAAKASQAAANNAAASSAAANEAAQSSAAAAAANKASATATSAASAASSTSAASGGGNEDAQAAQSSLTLLSNQVSTGFENDGQDVPTAGQIASLTSSNNFINFCATVPNLPLTNGQQVTTGSCNNAIMGVIPSSDHIPSGKFVSPANGDTVAANTAFTITMAVKNIDLGNFVNAKQNYYSAPQQVNSDGNIKGHTHFVIEELADGLAQTTPTNPLDFSFFQGVDGAQDANGQVSVTVSDGLPAGTYRLGSIVSSSNHQPALAPIAQHGLMDDVVYFTVSAGGAASSGSGSANNATAAAGNNAGSAASASAAAAAASSAAAAKGSNNNASGNAASSSAAAAAASQSAAAAKAKGNASGSAAAAAASQSAAAAKAAQAKGTTAKGSNNANTAQGKNGAQQAKKARRSFFSTSDY